MRRVRTRATATMLLVAGAMALFLTLSASAAQAGGGCHDSRSTSAAGVNVDLTGACFSPTVLYVRPGQTVTWTNTDGMAHNVTGLAYTWGSDKDMYFDASITYRFDQVGVYPYSCTLHPGMVGAVIVGNPKAPTSSAAAAPVAVVTSPPAPPASQPAAAAQTQTVAARSGASSEALWRTVALIAVGLFVASALVMGFLRLQLRRSRPTIAG